MVKLSKNDQMALLEKINNFEHYCDSVKDLQAKAKGDMFESLTYYLFKLSPILNVGMINIWNYDDIPLKIKNDLKLPKRDKGIDLLLQRNDEYFAIQCKFRQDCYTTIQWNELSTFFGLSFGLHDKIKGGFLVTNTYDLCEEVQNSTKVVSINGNFFDDWLPDNFFNNIIILNKKQIINYIKKEPFQHQLQCIAACKEYFVENKMIDIVVDEDNDDEDNDNDDNNENDEDGNDEKDDEEKDDDEKDDDGKDNNDNDDKNENEDEGDDNDGNNDDNNDINYENYEIDNDDTVVVKNNSTKDTSRAFIEVACGGGKSLLSYWIDKELNNEMTVVFVPSLYLLSQIYVDWVNQNFAEKVDIEYLLIGSDADVDDDTKDKANGLILNTDPDEIRKHIDRIKLKNKKCVVISTYQSANKLSQACVASEANDINIVFDFGIFDEAHKTVGQAGKQFSLMLHDDNLTIKKRLFMTATPKIFAGKDSKDVLSMNNQKYYGKKIYCYNTKNGIDDNRLVDYRLVTMIATNDEITKMITKNKLVKYKDSFTDEESNYLGTILLLLKKIHDGTSNHMVTYHNTIKKAKKFSEFLTLVNQLVYKNEGALCVNTFSAKTSMSQRRKIIKEFTDNEKSILCTARVLNEGINIPIIDSVCFVDPRQSTIDIVQCIGRSLRLYKDKKYAHIYIPTFIEDINDDAVDYDKVFGNTLRILKNMRSTDEGITEYFVLKDNGKKEAVRKILTFERMCTVTKSDEIALDLWVKNIQEKIWAFIDPFMIKYNKVKFWSDTQKRLPSPNSLNTQERCLGRWCKRMRYFKKNNKISETKIKILELINGWRWCINKNDIFNDNYNELKKWQAVHKRAACLGAKDDKERHIANFCRNQRQRRTHGTLSGNEIERLEQLSYWYWTKENFFNDACKELKIWIHNNGRIPRRGSKNVIERRIGAWCKKKKLDKILGKLTNDQIEALEQTSNLWTWETGTIIKKRSFEERFNELIQWYSSNKRIPSSKAKDAMECRLGQLCVQMRTKQKKGKLTNDKIQLLETITNWYWNS